MPIFLASCNPSAWTKEVWAISSPRSRPQNSQWSGPSSSSLFWPSLAQNLLVFWALGCNHWPYFHPISVQGRVPNSWEVISMPPITFMLCSDLLTPCHMTRENHYQQPNLFIRRTLHKTDALITPSDLPSGVYHELTPFWCTLVYLQRRQQWLYQESLMNTWFV